MNRQMNPKVIRRLRLGAPSAATQRQIAIKDAYIAILKEKIALNEYYEKAVKDAKAEAAAKVRKELEEEERKKALKKKNRSEAAKKAARTRRMDREIEEVAAKKARRGKATVAIPIEAILDDEFSDPAIEVASTIPSLSQTKFLGPAIEARRKKLQEAPKQTQQALKKHRTEAFGFEYSEMRPSSSDYNQ